MRGDARLGAACGLLLISLVIFSQAGPVNRSSRMLDGDVDTTGTEKTNEEIQVATDSTVSRDVCTVGDVVYQYGQAVPGRTPCERCLCLGDSTNGTGVSCEIQKCEAKPGCKALHRADHCCPLYQCECEQHGITYNNGQKLVDPYNPCVACYCRGGQITCSQIACFRRNDCEGRYVAGSCCPEYDHCPPSDSVTHKENGVQSLMDIVTKYKNNSNYSNGGNSLPDSENNGISVASKDTSNGEGNKNDSDDKNSNTKKINIKEVVYMQDKPLNNEIRIKEVLPFTSFDVSSGSTKAPTFTSETPNLSISEEVYINSDTANLTDDNEDSKPADDVSQPPPVLRIGDQLLFLKVGDLVPENAAGSTPSPVFTVIGAEGLQRVVEDPEEGFENRNILTEFANDTEKEIAILSTVESDVDLPIETENNGTLSVSTLQEKKTKLYEDNDTVTESLDEMLQDAISDLYETTTKSSLFTSNNDTNNQNEVIQNGSDTDNSNESFSDSASTYVETYTESPEEKSSPAPHLEEEPQDIPIEHLPEHNPEYPPIPEYMVLSVTEDSLESGSSELDFRGASSIDNVDTKDDEKIVIVKRPVIPLSSPSKHYHIEGSPVKIVPDILPFIRDNTTDESNNSESAASEDWLKATEKTETIEAERNSPLLTLDSSLPESILYSNRDSNEDDDTREYIFVTNNTFKHNDNVNDLISSEVTTDETTEHTEQIDLEGEFRSPGEPFLIPEWERNQTTEEPDVTAYTENNELYTVDQESIISGMNLTEEEDAEFKEKIYNSSSSRELDFENRLILESSTEDSKTTEGVQSSTDNIVSLSTEEVPTTMPDENNADNTVKTYYPTEYTDDTITNFIISTEHFNPISSTENIPTQGLVSTEKVLHIESEVVRDPESFDLNVDGFHSLKQKKSSALVSEMKNDSGKKHNILADLINLVGDVASIGNHDTEVSTVQNSIESFKSKNFSKKEPMNKSESAKDFIDIPKDLQIDSDQAVDNADVELTEYNFSGDKIDVEISTENEKVELTTKKIYIDKDGDERNKWKSTDGIVKDIEIIPKVENKVNKKHPSREKIIDELPNKNTNERINIQPIKESKPAIKNLEKSEVKKTDSIKNEDVIIYTTVQTTTASPLLKKRIEDGPKKINLSVGNVDPETLISVDNLETTTIKEQKYIADVETTENSYTSTVMKVSGKRSNMDEQMNVLNISERDKLTKRETNSQLTDSTGQIDDSLISILRGFFEQHFSH